MKTRFHKACKRCNRFERPGVPFLEFDLCMDKSCITEELHELRYKVKCYSHLEAQLNDRETKRWQAQLHAEKNAEALAAVLDEPTLPWWKRGLWKARLRGVRRILAVHRQLGAYDNGFEHQAEAMEDEPQSEGQDDKQD